MVNVLGADVSCDGQSLSRELRTAGRSLLSADQEITVQMNVVFGRDLGGLFEEQEPVPCLTLLFLSHQRTTTTVSYAAGL